MQGVYLNFTSQFARSVNTPLPKGEVFYHFSKEEGPATPLRLVKLWPSPSFVLLLSTPQDYIFTSSFACDGRSGKFQTAWISPPKHLVRGDATADFLPDSRGSLGCSNPTPAYVALHCRYFVVLAPQCSGTHPQALR